MKWAVTRTRVAIPSPCGNEPVTDGETKRSDITWRTEAAAQREADAWNSTGLWQATVIPA